VSEFRFAEPQWIHALWALLAFLALLFWLERRGGSALDRLVSATLQSRLVMRPGVWRRRARLLLVGLAGAFLIVALMRPQFGMRHVATPRVGAEIMVCLDTSRSMLAEDVAPNRLERAKAELVDLLSFLEGDQVGLIAFAGRATVLSPLTPDFGFLRLVLDGVGVHSVKRGGTRIGDAVQKAVDGFGPPGEASRAILLITDGEDHESFPRDAAKAAAEAGIRIIAVGFGDETGTEIHVTDPRTGARTRLVDGSGAPVRSRLDGELLRDLALTTEGAYVPAGTGVLDLESIYERHIARLTRGRLDARGRTVRDEGYQWAVLLALAFLVSSVVVFAGGSSKSSDRAPVGRMRSGATPLLLVLLLLQPHLSARAQELEPPAEESPSLPETQESVSEAPAELEVPREIYNRGVVVLARDEPDEAERWFRRARREARTDGELRAAAAYNLGWTFVERADALESSQPEKALGLLYEAADWFRDAVQQRPEDADSRHNLDVVLRRALLLADQIAQTQGDSFEKRLRELAESQRDLVARTAGVLEALAESSDANVEDRFRHEFRGLATTERTVLADADRLAAEIGQKRDAIEARVTQPGTTPDDSMDLVQLGNVLQYLHRARERMGQTRQQLRQRQADRGYRRASAALVELKRALDQFRDPVALLDLLVREATGIAASTTLLAASQSKIPGVEETPEAPAWLTLESLSDGQGSVAERTEELDLRLRAGIESPAPLPEDPTAQRVLAAAKEAEPLVNDAEKHLRRAVGAIDEEDLLLALREQRAGIVALTDAKERFLDLRGLIEAIYGDEKEIQDFLVGAEESERKPVLESFRPGLVAVQQKNLERSDRLVLLLEEDRVAFGASEPAEEGEQAEARAQEEKRFEAAAELLSLARKEMERIRDQLGDPEAHSPANWANLRDASTNAVRYLEGLRRLFFSLVEHLADVTEQQVDLADRTQDVAASRGAATDERSKLQLGPLVGLQQSLAQRSEQIALALEEQSRQEGDVREGEEDAEETSRRLRLAGEHVLAAESSMSEAAVGMEADPPQLDATRENQGDAITKLQEALALLVPPEQPEPGEGSSEAEQAGAGEQEEGEGEAGEDMDPAQLLQAVRDREAQRRRDRAGRESRGYETVEKDW
jgi:Ca-activated chloride channel family protein